MPVSPGWTVEPDPERPHRLEVPDDCGLRLVGVLGRVEPGADLRPGTRVDGVERVVDRGMSMPVTVIAGPDQMR